MLADFYMISASRDDQEAADETNTKLPNPVGGGGALTTALLKVLNFRNVLSYMELIALVRTELRMNGHYQVPQLTSSIMFDSRKRVVLGPSVGGRKFGLLIGINYVGQEGELFGCHNDIRNSRRYLIGKLGFKENDITVLMDDGRAQNPTRNNIENAISNLCNLVVDGDFVWVHYAGHGRFVRDVSGDEKDTYDETLVPLDFNISGEMNDDDLKNLLVLPMPLGVSVMVIMDCCHSGSILDLPYTIIK